MSDAIRRCFPLMVLFLLISISSAKENVQIAIFRTDAPYAREQEVALRKGIRSFADLEKIEVDYIDSRVVSSNLENFSDTAILVKEVLMKKPKIIATIGTQATAPTWSIVKDTGIPLVFAGVTFPKEMELSEAEVLFE